MILPLGEAELAVGDLRASVAPDASLRAVTIAGARVLDGVTFAVRDAAWGTAATEILECGSFADEADGARGIRFVCRQAGETTDVIWTGEYRAAAGRLRCAISGVAQRDQLVNRAGLALLHPIRMRGVRVRSETGGGATETEFPVRIAPDVILTGVRAMSFRPPDGPEVTIRFEGDEFEMEDHRNWTDAGWKTYCTPLARPAPRTLRRGESVEQLVELSWRPDAGWRSTDPEASSIVLGEVSDRRVPRIGAGVADRPDHSAGAAGRIRALGLAFLAVELGADPETEQRLADAAAEARELGLPLRVTAACGPSDVAGLIARIARLPVAVEGVTLVDSRTDAASPGLLDAMASSSAPFPVGSGTRGYFAELNRMRVPLDAAQGCAFSVSPQVHHTDDELVLDTTLSYPDVTRDALAIADGRPLHVGPVTLRQRLNVHEGAGRAPAAGDAPGTDVDPRQHGPVAAALAIGAAAGFAGADTVELFRTVGPRGLIDDSAPTSELERVLAVLTACAGRRVREIEGEPDRSLVVLAVENDLVVVADRSGAERSVTVSDRGRELRVVVPALGVAVLDPSTGSWYAV